MIRGGGSANTAPKRNANAGRTPLKWADNQFGATRQIEPTPIQQRECVKN